MDPERTRLIVGLGNPGGKYAATRHNVGFMTIDEVARRQNAVWHDRTQDLGAYVAVVPRHPPRSDAAGGSGSDSDGTENSSDHPAAGVSAAVPDASVGRDSDGSRGTREASSDGTDAPRLVLVKPVTFMNNAGHALSRLLARTNVAPRHALAIYDDMDLPLGVLRLRQRGSAGTHNGMRSIVREIATEDIPRLRLGISQPSATRAIDHVLGVFGPDEQPIVAAMVARAADAAQDWAIHGAARAMNRYNKG